MNSMSGCIFCSIIKGSEKAVVVWEDDRTLSFMDANPLNPGHTLAVPKKHYATLLEMPDSEVGELFQTVAKVVRAVWKAVKADGMNVAQSNGEAASQDVFHVHVHIVPRFFDDTCGGAWPTRKKMSQSEISSIGESIRRQLIQMNERASSMNKD